MTIFSLSGFSFKDNGDSYGPEYDNRERKGTIGNHS